MTKYTIKLDTENHPSDMLKRGLLEIVHQERQKAVAKVMRKAKGIIMKHYKEYSSKEIDCFGAMNRILDDLSKLEEELKTDG